MVVRTGTDKPEYFSVEADCESELASGEGDIGEGIREAIGSRKEGDGEGSARLSSDKSEG